MIGANVQGFPPLHDVHHFGNAEPVPANPEPANPEPANPEPANPRGVRAVNIETDLIPPNAIIKKYPKNPAERVEVVNCFKKGDIIFTTQKVFFLNPVSCLQFLFKLLRIRWPFNETQYNHAAIVVKVDKTKNIVLVADIVTTKGSTPRVYDILTNYSSRLGFNSTYKVIRSRDVTTHQKIDGQESFLERVAAVADRMGVMNGNLTKQLGLTATKTNKKVTNPGFGYKEGFKAIVYGPQTNVSSSLKMQLFQQIYDEHVKNTVSTSGPKPRKFFCSYFIAHVLQQVEAYRAFIELTKTAAGVALLNSLNILIEQVKNQSGAEKSRIIHEWTMKSAGQYGEALWQKMQRFKFNPETMAPGALEAQLERDDNFAVVLHIRG